VRKISPATTLKIYPERDEPLESGIKKVYRTVAAFIPHNFSKANNIEEVVGRIQRVGAGIKNLSAQELREVSQDLRYRLRHEGFTDELVARSFAVVREAAHRTRGMSHFDVQLFGGWVLLQGMVAEMETGEGKTLTATLPASTAAFAGIPVHIVTVNDYLATRDAEWMRPVYEYLGLSVGIITQGMDAEAKQRAYACDITYCTNKSVAFDYLRDRIVLGNKTGHLRMQLERLYGEKSRLPRLLLRGLYFAIVDEADSVLIDESRTPLIISGANDSSEEQEVFAQVLSAAEDLKQGKDYTVDIRQRYIELTASGNNRLGKLAEEKGIAWIGHQRREELVCQALTALHLFILDKDYLVKEGKVQIIDEFTGRLMEDRSWERGLHQFIELKEGCAMTGMRDTLARISYQRFFRRYQLLAGMTGTASEVAGELGNVYGLKVVQVPTNRPLQRKYFEGRVLPTASQKWDAVVSVVKSLSQQGRPILVGTRSVADSEHLSEMLSSAGLAHEVLNARQDEDEAKIIEEAGKRGRITVATNMAGRGTDIKLGSGVSEIGGLHVIATERHESGRIDRQLFGRCARQGDPGSCQAIVSLEDELVKHYGGPLAKVFTYKDENKRAISRLVGNLLIRGAQKHAERVHARMRRELLKMDKQMGTALAFSGKYE
jgi:preprotein translocase subunit SecA